MKKTVFFFILILFVTSLAAAQDATTLYNEGLKLKKEDKAKEAAEKFQKAVTIRPEFTEARYEWAWCQNHLKQYEGALINLRQVRHVWPEYLKVQFELGWAFEKTNRYDSAIVAYKKCIEIKPETPGANKQLGIVLYSKEDYPAALEQFRKYEVLMKDSIPDYLFWYRKGFMQNVSKDYSGALVSLERSMRYKKDYINTHLETGFAYSRLKKDDDAIRAYMEAMKLDPKSHVPLNGIGEVYRDNKKDINEAMNWYKKTLALNPTERKACFGMGYCLNSQGKYSDAIPYLKTAIEKESTYTAAYTELGYSYYMTGLNTDAIRNLTKAMELNPANENSRYYLTLVYINMKDKKKAEEVLDQLKKLSSKHVTTLQPKVNAL